MNGTVPDEVLALNPNVRPELLSVGDELVLPPPATPLVQQVVGTEVPLAIHVLSVRFYQTPSGGGWILGEVVNQGLVAAEGVKVTIFLLDENGGSLGSVSAWTAATLIPAGERSPFGIFLPDFAIAPRDVDDRGCWRAFGGGVGVTVARSDGGGEFAEITENQVTLTGTLFNSSTVTTTASLVATLYDSAGNVSGFTQTVLENGIGGGDSAEFTLTLAPPGALAQNYRLLAVGQQTD